ncbi:carbohydrate ABC transporter permease [Microbacterium sp. M28]|uniref:carbohydrate ABC transporter permease n=1 Tax=Microbacterium sp. M28 TaxID=2962064 RepID=UPI0021F4A9D7|nr:carbohydrate ABC transporter permease [Microbacterium sp. M28]UYO96549.1 carbohydrate ABC transporter permease [Microbacterium sp. M28]
MSATSTLTPRRSKTDATMSRPVKRPNYIRIGLWIALVISLIIWIMPLVFILFTSLKTEADAIGTPVFLPPLNPDFGNYTEAIESGNLLGVGLNSLIIALVKVPVGLLISAAAAFAIARIRFRRNRLLLAAVAMGAMVPVQVAIAPLFQVINSFGLLNTHIGVILPYIGFGIPYQIFILYGFFRQIPEELDESARIDGASNARLFWQIILPLSGPALAALFILDFVATWNEYGMALVLLQSSDSWTVPLAIQGFQSQYTSSYGPINAFTLMSVIPVVIVYLLFQRYFVSGAFAGSVKG